ELIMRIVSWIMVLAPLGILALLIKLVGTQDVALLTTVGGFIVLIFGTTLVHGLVVLPLILYLVTGKSPLWFLRGASDPLVPAFPTSSSTAASPVPLRFAQEQLHVRRDVARFVIPQGATVNMDGTARYDAAAALFVANLLGVDLTLAQHLIIFCTA